MLGHIYLSVDGLSDGHQVTTPFTWHYRKHRGKQSSSWSYKQTDSERQTVHNRKFMLGKVNGLILQPIAHTNYKFQVALLTHEIHCKLKKALNNRRE